MMLYVSPVSLRTRRESTVFEIGVVEANPSVMEATLVLIQGKWAFASVCNYDTSQYLLVLAYQEDGDFSSPEHGLIDKPSGWDGKEGRRGAHEDAAIARSVDYHGTGLDL